MARNIYTVELSGADLANKLAVELTDLEFELLVRKRIKLQFEDMRAADDNLSESHEHVSFSWYGANEPEWKLGIGVRYGNTVSAEGQVLSKTAEDVFAAHQRKNGNKLSFLLPAPSPAVSEDEAIPL